MRIRIPGTPVTQQVTAFFLLGVLVGGVVVAGMRQDWLPLGVLLALAGGTTLWLCRSRTSRAWFAMRSWSLAVATAHAGDYATVTTPGPGWTTYTRGRIQRYPATPPQGVPAREWQRTRAGHLHIDGILLAPMGPRTGIPWTRNLRLAFCNDFPSRRGVRCVSASEVTAGQVVTLWWNGADAEWALIGYVDSVQATEHGTLTLHLGPPGEPDTPVLPAALITAAHIHQDQP